MRIPKVNPVAASWLAVLLALPLACGGRSLAAESPVPPRLFPDYADAVIPPNIAPLNCAVREPGQAFQIKILGSAGSPIEISSRDGHIRIPPKPWHALLEASKGGTLRWEVSARDDQGAWRQFAPVTNRVALDPIDSTLVYRRLKPLYNYFVTMGIYQRSLETSRETPVLENRQIGGGCLNCHTFLQHDTDRFALNLRGQGPVHPMLLAISNQVRRVENTMGYLSWHPSGQAIAFSANQLSMFFHTVGETRDVFDADSRLGLFSVTKTTPEFPPVIGTPERNETWPAWSPDGKHLYFSSVPKLPLDQFRKVRYDILRVPFDLATGQWGSPETVVSSIETGQSATQPRISPDGQWLLYCLSPYGNFPVYQPGSDLYVMHLGSRQSRRLELNSDRADSWHCWSSNGRWIVFSSKRIDNFFSRPHFSYFDVSGLSHKAFVLPQTDPSFYQHFIENYNIPELVRRPVSISPDALARAAALPKGTPSPRSNNEYQQAPHP